MNTRKHLVLRGSLIAVLALVFALVGAPVAAADVVEGRPAPEFDGVTDARGAALKLKKFKGKWVVLTFGASWCKPCAKELPAWDRLAKTYKPKGVVFIAINTDRERQNGAAFMKRLGLKNLTVAYGTNQKTVDTYGPSTMPSTFIIGPRGIVHRVHKGYNSGDEKKLAAELDKLLK